MAQIKERKTRHVPICIKKSIQSSSILTHTHTTFVHRNRREYVSPHHTIPDHHRHQHHLTVMHCSSYTLVYLHASSTMVSAYCGSCTAAHFTCSCLRGCRMLKMHLSCHFDSHQKKIRQKKHTHTQF